MNKMIEALLATLTPMVHYLLAVDSDPEDSAYPEPGRLVIFYSALSKNRKIGSTNGEKIIAMAGNRQVACCDIAEFDGQMINPDWYGSYPSSDPALLDFDFGYQKT